MASFEPFTMARNKMSAQDGSMTEIRKPGRINKIIPAERIAKAVQALACRIEADYGTEPLVLVCVLKGAIFFFQRLGQKYRQKRAEHGIRASGQLRRRCRWSP